MDYVLLRTMRPLRFLPPAHLIEVTSRTVHGRMLLRPDRPTCDLILAVLGRAQARYEMRIVAFVFLSNHFHLLLLPDSTRQLAAFMAYVGSNVARGVGRLHNWREKFWARRYHAIVVSDEEAAQVGRLRYVLAHGAKEGFVSKPIAWPGPNSIRALVEGATIQGTWFDRTAEYEARRRGIECSPKDFCFQETVTLTPLPCWAHWHDEQRRRAIVDLLAEIEGEAKALRNGRQPLGREAILRQEPHQPPMRCKRTYAPAFHTATTAAWQLLREAYRTFLNAFWRASQRLRSGDLSAHFPVGSFPPALPYVAIPSG